MEARAHLRYARISPRKVSIVLDLIRNKPVEYAMAVLEHTPKSACEYLKKLLKSAMANAVITIKWTYLVFMFRNVSYVRDLFLKESDLCPKEERTESKKEALMLL